MQKILVRKASTASTNSSDSVTTTNMTFYYVFSKPHHHHRFIHKHYQTNLENTFSIEANNDFQSAQQSY